MVAAGETHTPSRRGQTESGGCLTTALIATTDKTTLRLEFPGWRFEGNTVVLGDACNLLCKGAAELPWSWGYQDALQKMSTPIEVSKKPRPDKCASEQGGTF